MVVLSIDTGVVAFDICHWHHLKTMGFFSINYGLSVNGMDLLLLGWTFSHSLWMNPPTLLVAMPLVLKSCLLISVNQICILGCTHWCLFVKQIPIVEGTGSSCNHTCSLASWQPFQNLWVFHLSLLLHHHHCRRHWPSSDINWVAWAGNKAQISLIALLPQPVMWMSRRWVPCQIHFVGDTEGVGFWTPIQIGIHW